MSTPPPTATTQVLLSMRRRGVPADEVTMNSILDGLVSCTPPRVREAETVLELMAGWGLKPNQVMLVLVVVVAMVMGVVVVVAVVVVVVVVVGAVDVLLLLVVVVVDVMDVGVVVVGGSGGGDGGGGGGRCSG